MKRAYQFKAANPAGGAERGYVNAPGMEAAVELLYARGLFPTSVIELGTGVPGPQRKLAVQDHALGLRLLATLLQTGMGISDVLRAFQEVAPAAWRHAIPGLKAEVTQGSGLAAALEASALRIPPITIGIISAGEAAGTLAAAVARAAEVSERRAELRQSIVSALAYPAILCVAGGFSLWLLAFLVLPRFADILADLGQPLPASTAAVLVLGHHMSSPWVLLLLSSTLGVSTLALSRERAQPALHKFVLQVPYLGPLVMASTTAETCLALTGLLDSGIGIVPALQHAARVSGNHAVAARIQAARAAIIAGTSAAQALSRNRALTPTALRLVDAGERSGDLTRMFAHAALVESDRVRTQLRALVSMLEPVLILFFSAVVAFVAAGLLQAIYALRPSL